MRRLSFFLTFTLTLPFAIDFTPIDPRAVERLQPTCVLKKIPFEVIVGFRKDFRRELAASRDELVFTARSSSR